MPLVNIKLLEGHIVDQKKELVTEDMPRHNFARAGTLASKYHK